MKGSVLGLLIAAGAFGASTIYLAVQLQDERAQADLVAEQTRALNARIAQLEKAQAELDALKLDADGLEPGDAPQSAGASGPAPAIPDATVAQESAERGPFAGGPPPERSAAMQKMLRAQMRANFKRLNSDIGARLGLSPEDANRLIDLMIDQQMAGMQGRLRGQNSTPQQRAADAQVQQEKHRAEVSALIGADKMAAYDAYQESMPARAEVEALSRQLEGNDAEALTEDQRNRMVAALAEERKRVPAPKMAESVSREEYEKEYAAWQQDYNQRAASRTSSILNQDQQTAYNEYQQWTQEMRQNFQSRRAAREAAGGRPPAGPTGVPPR